jgi:hypothetical protein
MKRTIDRNTLPCRFEEHWTENQSPFGSGLYWPMEVGDCGRPESTDVEKEKTFVAYVEGEHADCNKSCPGYEPVDVDNCEKHGEFIKGEVCDGCMEEGILEAEKAAEEYYKDIND